jgi:hypothetical protein
VFSFISSIETPRLRGLQSTFDHRIIGDSKSHTRKMPSRRGVIAPSKIRHVKEATRSGLCRRRVRLADDRAIFNFATFLLSDTDGIKDEKSQMAGAGSKYTSTNDVRIVFSMTRGAFV